MNMIAQDLGAVAFTESDEVIAGLQSMDSEVEMAEANALEVQHSRIEADIAAASNVCAGLQSLHDSAARASAQGGLDGNGGDVLLVAAEALLATIGVQSSTGLPGMQAYNSNSKGATVAGMQSFGEWISGIWNSIVKAVSKATQAVAAWFKKWLGTVERLEKAGKKLRLNAHNREDTKGILAEPTFEVSNYWLLTENGTSDEVKPDDFAGMVAEVEEYYGSGLVDDFVKSIEETMDGIKSDPDKSGSLTSKDLAYVNKFKKMYKIKSTTVDSDEGVEVSTSQTAFKGAEVFGNGFFYAIDDSESKGFDFTGRFHAPVKKQFGGESKKEIDAYGISEIISVATTVVDACSYIKRNDPFKDFDDANKVVLKAAEEAVKEIENAERSAEGGEFKSIASDVTAMVVSATTMLRMVNRDYIKHVVNVAQNQHSFAVKCYKNIK